uniref:Secreted protein n=1 Tax=Triticum urartu TaxID=4572 RepID=A0A8R7Q205_TRIUA
MCIPFFGSISGGMLLSMRLATATSVATNTHRCRRQRIQVRETPWWHAFKMLEQVQHRLVGHGGDLTGAPELRPQWRGPGSGVPGERGDFPFSIATYAGRR